MRMRVRSNFKPILAREVKHIFIRGFVERAAIDLERTSSCETKDFIGAFLVTFQQFFSGLCLTVSFVLRPKQ